MKKSFKTIISFMLITLLALSFSSCSIFESMRQNALEAAETTIYATPEEAQIIAQYNKILNASVEKAEVIKESVSYSAGSPKVLKDGEDAGILNAASKQLKTFIMSAKPGNAQAYIKGAPEGTEAKAMEESLIAKIDEASVLGFDFNRNIAVENVTDEKGNNLTDDEGNNITEEKIKDNVLHLTFNYFENKVVSEEAETNENGEAVEETTVIYAEDATIEAIFGSNKDKETVLKNFEAVKDYIVVSDYEIEYKNCLVTTDMDLEGETVPFISFQKNMTVTAKAEGVGALSSYGEIVVVFDLTMTTRYEFTYPAEDDTADSTEDTTAEETTATEETTDEAETSAEEASEETTVTEETTEISEEASAEETTAA